MATLSLIDVSTDEIGSRPASMRNVVDLTQPGRPTRTTNPPESIEKLSHFTAATLPLRYFQALIKSVVAMA